MLSVHSANMKWQEDFYNPVNSRNEPGLKEIWGGKFQIGSIPFSMQEAALVRNLLCMHN